jgi:hypothetical protein
VNLNKQGIFSIELIIMTSDSAESLLIGKFDICQVCLLCVLIARRIQLVQHHEMLVRTIAKWTSVAPF